MLVLDKAFALTLGNDVKIVSGLSLLDLDFLRLAHDKFNFGDHVVFDLLVECKDDVLLQLLGEDESRHGLFERWTDHSEKLTELVLVVQSLLDILQV